MVQLGGKQVGEIGYGLMRFTWHDTPKPYSAAIPTMRRALQNGANAWNGAAFYGPPDANSLQLLNAYFTQYPEDASKVVLSIKGGFNLATNSIDGSAAGCRAAVDDALTKLGGKKNLDLFEITRVDPTTPIETTIGALGELVKEGKIGGISICEVSADTIRRAAKVHSIAGVEVEFSIFTPDILTNGVGKACGELGIPIIAYSPFSRGLLTGSVKGVEGLDNMRASYPRFQPDALKENLKLVEAVERLAKKKGVTVGQFSLGWILWHSGRNGMPTIIPIPGGSTEAQVAENTKVVHLTDAEGMEVEKLRQASHVSGHRYPDWHAALEFA